MASPPPQQVELQELIHRVVDRAHESLHGLITKTLPGQLFQRRRTELTAYIHRTRRQLSQLLTLLEWATSRRDILEVLQHSGAVADANSDQFRNVLDSLFWFHGDMFRKRVATRPYDISTAIDVLSYGSVPRLPRELALKPMGILAETTLEALEHAIRSSLLIREEPPAFCASVLVEDGLLKLTESGYFRLCLTLETPDPSSSPWRLLNLEVLLPKQDTEAGAYSPELEGRHRARLLELVGAQLENKESALFSACATCHRFCNALRLEALLQQAKVLSAGSWKDRLGIVDNVRAGGGVGLTSWAGTVSSGAQRSWVMFMDQASEGEHGAGDEVKELAVSDCPRLAGSCFLRVAAEVHEGLEWLTAYCGVMDAEPEPDAQLKCVILCGDPTSWSAAQLLDDAVDRLTRWRLAVIVRSLQEDVEVQKLGVQDLRYVVRGNVLHVEVFGRTQLHVLLDRKSGACIVKSNSAAAETRRGAEEWQSALNSFLSRAEPGVRVAHARVFARLIQALAVDRLEVAVVMSDGITPTRKYKHVFSPTPLVAVVPEEDDPDAPPPPVRTFLHVMCMPYCALPHLDNTGERWVTLEIAMPAPPAPLQPEIFLVVSHLEPETPSNLVGCIPRMCSRVALAPFVATNHDAGEEDKGVKKRRISNVEGWQSQVLDALRITPKLTHLQALLNAVQDSNFFSITDADAMQSLLHGSSVRVLVPSGLQSSISDVTLTCHWSGKGAAVRPTWEWVVSLPVTPHLASAGQEGDRGAHAGDVVELEDLGGGRARIRVVAGSDAVAHVAVVMDCVRAMGAVHLVGKELIQAQEAGNPLPAQLRVCAVSPRGVVLSGDGEGVRGHLTLMQTALSGTRDWVKWLVGPRQTHAVTSWRIVLDDPDLSQQGARQWLHELESKLDTTPAVDVLRAVVRMLPHVRTIWRGLRAVSTSMDGSVHTRQRRSRPKPSFQVRAWSEGGTLAVACGGGERRVFVTFDLQGMSVRVARVAQGRPDGQSIRSVSMNEATEDFWTTEGEWLAEEESDE